jgi:hypothetical protein
MAWYRTGTISLTNGSTAVTGSGTAWISNAAVGEALLAPDGKLYEIANIASDTSITLGSEANCASAMIALNSALAEQLVEFKKDVE